MTILLKLRSLSCDLWGVWVGLVDQERGPSFHTVISLALDNALLYNGSIAVRGFEPNLLNESLGSLPEV